MVSVMETNSGKILDEACNRYNEVYSDEVLYASWAEAPHLALAPPPVAAAAADAGRGQRTDVEGFMARLYAAQG
jgi:hypothetical protein